MFSGQFISVVDPNSDLCVSLRQKESMQNIRTLKFAVNHFYEIYQKYKSIDTDIGSDTLSDYLLNQWNFIYGLSIELKRNKISLENKQGLDKFSPIADFDLDIDEKDDENMPDEKNEENYCLFDPDFAPYFFNTYYRNRSANYIYYEGLYNFVVGGIDYDAKELYQFTENANARFKVEGNSAQEAVDNMMKGFWNNSDEEFLSKLNLILDGVEKATLVNPASYYNASVYLLRFSNLIGKTHEEIIEVFRNGVRNYIDGIEVTPLVKDSLTMLPITKESPCDEVYSILNAEMNRKLCEFQIKNGRTLVELFKTDIEQFVLQLIPNNRVVPQYATIPVLNTIPDKVIVDRAATIQAPDIMRLDMMVRQRAENLHEKILEEKDFYIALKQELFKRLEENSLSGFTIKEYLYKNLEKMETIIHK